MNMPCENARPLIPSYLDGELGEELAAPLRQHLLACPACREVTKQETGLKRWFVAPKVSAVPAGFAARVAQQAFAGDSTERQSTLVPFGRRFASPEAGPEAPAAADAPDESVRGFVMRLTSLAAAALLIFALGIRYRSLPSSSELDATSRDTVEEILRKEREREAAAERQRVEASEEDDAVRPDGDGR